MPKGSSRRSPPAAPKPAPSPWRLARVTGLFPLANAALTAAPGPSAFYRASGPATDGLFADSRLPPPSRLVEDCVVMPKFHPVRFGAALATACGLVVTTDAVWAADLATPLGVEAAAPAQKSSAVPDVATPGAALPAASAPGLLPQTTAQADPAAETAAAAPAPPGMRFPTRILLLSGANAGAARELVVLGDPAPADRAANTAETPPGTGVRAPLNRGPDPLAGTKQIDPATTGGDAEKILATLLPPRTDGPADWHAPLEPLHACGEPRALAPCVPPPPCHPALPPRPHDLVGQVGCPTCGPIYRGPCAPRSGECHDGPLAPLHRACDRLFDLFYTPR